MTLAASITVAVMAVTQLLPLPPPPPPRLRVVGCWGVEEGVRVRERRPEVIPLLKSNKKPHSYF